MVAIREDQYNQVVTYIQKYVAGPIGGISYEGYKESVGKVKKAKPQGIAPEIEEGFNRFWSEYPGISRFEYMGKKFEGERVLKANKQVCLKLYNDAILDIINKTPDINRWIKDDVAALLKAMQVQVETIKQESYKSGQNRMQYMKSCEVYLRQKAYEGWIGEEMPAPITPNKKTLDTIDI